MNGSSSSGYDTYYGNYKGDPDHYADLTDYSELRVYCPDNTNGFRCFFINADKSGVNQKYTDDATWNPSDKYYSLDLSTVTKWNSKVALKAIKHDNKGGNPTGCNITNIVVYKTPAAGSAEYTITGKGLLDNTTKELLVKNTVTSIDATGMTNVTTITLNSANPNCLIYANAGKVSNAKNVIVSGTCANLELTDGKPFKAPSAFTATEATFTKTVSAAGFATMVVPFNVATLPEGVKAYELTGVSGSTITYNEVTSLTANEPVLIKAAAGTYEFTATSAAVAATPSGEVTNGLLKGGYSTMTTGVNAGDYVLQNNASGINFYLVNTGTGAEVKPFRAYLHYEALGEAPALVLNFEEETGINEVSNTMEDSGNAFDLQGRRVANPTKGLYIQNGKKVLVK